MKKNYANRTEKKIMRVLFQQRVPLTDYKVSQECQISYQTAKKYLDKLVEEKLVLVYDERKPRKLVANFELLEKGSI